MASAGNAGVGFLRGFLNARERKAQREEEEQEKKARLQLFEIQMGREKRLQAQQDQEMEERKAALAARNDLFSTIQRKTGPQPIVSQPLPGTGVQLGDVDQTMAAPRQLGLAEALADPEVFLKSLQAGVPLPGPAEDPNAKLRGLLENPELFAAEMALRRANATQINTGDQFGKIPPGYALVPGPDGKPVLQRLEGAPPTPGQSSMDQAFGTDAAAWVAAGGFADTQKSIQQLGDSKKALEDVANSKVGKKNLTGPVVAKLPDFAKALFNPEAVATREAVEEVVQRNLRLVLGAQFTEKEGERLIARAYNENLSEKENAKRVGRLMTQLESAAKAKQEAVDYFNEKGTLEGFKGKVWTLADFDPEGAALPEGIPDGSVQIGTSGGKPVYQAPNGKQYIVD